MKQILQNLSTGESKLVEAPAPQARPEVRWVEPTTVAPAPAAKQPKHAPEKEIIDRFKFLELWD